MNNIEHKMLDILKRLKTEGGILAVKAEFEAEGTRTEELLRLVEIARKADLKIGLKIGGCEAIRDLIESKQIGVDYIIAPMVESEYALSKFIEAKNKIYDRDERKDTDFLINIETKSGFERLKPIVELAKSEDAIDGIVFGRVDFVGSLGADRDSVNGENITEFCITVSRECKDNHLDFVVGGAVSSDAIEALEEINQIHLTRFETRKIIFSSGALSSQFLKRSLLDAVHFELLWLQNKRSYYSLITSEDDKRISMLDKRWKLLSNTQS